MTAVLEDCHLCGSQKTLSKLISSVRIAEQDKREIIKPGDIVRQHIDDARRDIEREKETMIQEHD